MGEEDLKQFRQWGSKTLGHPENFETPGPLGQGIANDVGLALAERHLAARYKSPSNIHSRESSRCHQKFVSAKP
ncbi:hypothetical protein K2173_007636 [Erythroxylum novogranatense]|uniref:Transketolase N-terminal domain-containing protein n=1 Tax=Erythroxylum novogranatense TaxID=1862640 RepID=A0AAV8TS55_9ROSI|nr:hypothetical protein K2173_007636 [Erythroxylum novogranatense]